MSPIDASLLVKYNLVCRTREVCPSIHCQCVVMRVLIRVDFHRAQSCADLPSDASLDTC